MSKDTEPGPVDPATPGAPAGEGETISTEVPALLAGVRADRSVAMVADVSRAVATQLIAEGRVLVALPPAQPASIAITVQAAA